MSDGLGLSDFSPGVEVILQGMLTERVKRLNCLSRKYLVPCKGSRLLKLNLDTSATRMIISQMNNSFRSLFLRVLVERG